AGGRLQPVGAGGGRDRGAGGRQYVVRARGGGVGAIWARVRYRRRRHDRSGDERRTGSRDDRAAGLGGARAVGGGVAGPVDGLGPAAPGRDQGAARPVLGPAAAASRAALVRPRRRRRTAAQVRRGRGLPAVAARFSRRGTAVTGMLLAKVPASA